MTGFQLAPERECRFCGKPTRAPHDHKKQIEAEVRHAITEGDMDQAIRLRRSFFGPDRARVTDRELKQLVFFARKRRRGADVQRYRELLAQRQSEAAT